MVKDQHLWSLFIRTTGLRKTGKNLIFSLQLLYHKNNKTLVKIKKKLSSKFGKSNSHQSIQVKRSKLSKFSEKCSVWVLNKPNKSQIKHHQSLKEKEKTKQIRSSNL